MAIEGVPTFENPQAIDGINVSDRAELAVAALEIIYGTEWDRDQAKDGFNRDFDLITTKLGDSRPIETYPHMPLATTVEGKELTVESAFAAVDTMQRRDGTSYPPTYPFQEDQDNTSRKLWTPGQGYDGIDANRMNMPGEAYDPQAATIHARAAFVDGPREEEPLLHLTGLAFDRQSPGYDEGEPTQVEELARLTAEFEAAHPDLNHRAIILGGFAALTIQRRLEGRAGVEKPMPMEWGFMRIPYLGRKAVGGVSWVGLVNSHGDQPWLRRSYGYAYLHEGFGVSVGLNEA